MPYSNPEQQKAFQREWKRRKKDWFAEFKKTLNCNRCGFSHPAAMQFHHLADKERAVGKLVQHNANEEKVRAEIAKCEVLCANCHAIEHHNQQPLVMQAP